MGAPFGKQDQPGKLGLQSHRPAAVSPQLCLAICRFVSTMHTDFCLTSCHIIPCILKRKSKNSGNCNPGHALALPTLDTPLEVVRPWLPPRHTRLQSPPLFTGDPFPPPACPPLRDWAQCQCPPLPPAGLWNPFCFLWRPQYPEEGLVQ